MTSPARTMSVRRSVALLLSALVVANCVVVPLLGVGSPARAAAAPTAVSVEGLTTNGRVNPLGIPGDAPSFGWKSISSRRGVTQSAYEIQVGSTVGGSDVWTTGKVASPRQTDIAYDGPALTSSTRYFWRVRVWDEQGAASEWSQSAWFETGLLTAEDWGSAAWVGKPRPTYTGWTDYTVTETFKLNAIAFGTFLRATDTRNAYMWQINVGSTATATPQLVPHREVNGNYTVLPAVNLTAFGFTRAGLLSGTHNVAFQLSGSTITTTLDGTVVDTRSDTTFASGRVGIRTYGSESVTLSQFKVTRSDGTVLADPSFVGRNPLSGGTIANGQLTVSGTVDALLSGAENNEPLLRKSFQTTSGKTIESARVYASAHGIYELSLNGHRVGDQFLAPGYTEYDKRIQSQTYDVTDLVEEGANGFGAELGDGWWAGKVGLAGKYQYGTDLALVARLKITYTDGTSQWVDTDSSWKWSVGPYVATDNQLGETYDARFEQPGWDTATFDDSMWAPVTTVASDTAKLSPQPDEPVRQTGVVDTVKVTQPTPGVQIYDLGQNMVGVSRVTITGKAGETVKLRHAEVLNPDGSMYVANLRAALATDYYTFAEDGTITYQPTFTQHGFRYIEVSGLSTLPAASAVKGVVLGSDLASTGGLSTSNAMLNQLMSNVRWGARGNFLSIPTDTPARDERLGWTGDINIFSPTASYLFDTRAFLDKWMTDVRDEQTTDGQIPAVVPSTNGAFGASGPGWEDAIVAVPYAVYRAYGDLRLVKKNWASMEKFYDFAAAKIGADNLGAYSSTFFTTTDWLSLDDTTGASNDVKTTAIWADTVRMMADMATALGDPRAAEFAARYEQIKKDFVAAFVKSDGTISGGAQTVYAMALGMGLITDPSLQKKVGDVYVAKLAQSDNHLQTGFIGTPWLLPALTNIGRDDLAYTLLLKQDYPSWGYEISKGATTVWERWNSIQPDGTFGPVDMNSFNHYAYGAVADWMHRYIGGIQIKAPGYRESIIEPHPGGGLTHADDSIDTVYGALTDKWQTTDQGMTMEVTVPANTTSEIRIPAANIWSVTEGGRLLHNVDGVQKVSYDAAAQRADIVVGSGTYSFAANDQLAGVGGIMTALEHLKDSVDSVDLTDEQVAHLTAGIADASDSVRAALDAVLADNTADELTGLQQALTQVGALREWLATAGIDAATAAGLDNQVVSIARNLARLVSSVTGISVTLAPLTDPILRGDTAHAVITIKNGSDIAMSAVKANITIDGLLDHPITVNAPTLAPGAQADLAFEVPVAAAARVAAYDADVEVRLTGADGAEYEQSAQVAGWLTVATKLSIDSVAVAYPQAGLANLSVSITNDTSNPVAGRVRVAAPAGWPAIVPSAMTVIAPHGSTQIQVPVYLPREATPGSYTVNLVFEDRGATLALGSARLQVPNLTLPPVEAFSDYVDFGNTTSEAAHSIAASATSGISTEAGYTRRYSHNNTPGSWYSAEVAVPAGMPFLLRMRETWNTAGTKDYNVFIDGELLKRVHYDKADGGGVTEYQLAVTKPSMLNNDGTVTVKFEYPSADAALQYYDPSIADLWAIPTPDTLAPAISAVTGDDSKLGDNGWYRAPVELTLDAADDTDPAPRLEYRVDGDWTAYSGTVTVSQDGKHSFAYRATDAAGNTSDATLQVDLDATRPTVRLSAGPAGDVAYGSVPAAPTCDAADATSGVASCVVTGYSTALGDHTLTATATDMAGNVATATSQYTVVKADQTLSIDAPGSTTFGDPEVTVAAAATSGLPVTLAADGACTLTGSTLTMTGAGQCTLTATQEGDEHYNPAQASRTITVGRGGQTLTIAGPASATYGDADFSVTASSSAGLPVTLTAVGACTVAGARVHLVNTGDCQLTASQAGNDDYNPAPDVSRTITVNKATQTIRLTVPERTTYGVGTIAVAATATSALPVSLTASGACTISGRYAKVIAAGTCRITATQGGSDLYEPATASAVIMVDEARFSRAGARLRGKAQVGRKLRVTVTFAPSAAHLTYTWVRNGRRIRGVDGASYRLRARDQGTRIWVKVTGERANYQPSTVTTERVRVAKRR